MEMRAVPAFKFPGKSTRHVAQSYMNLSLKTHFKSA